MKYTVPIVEVNYNQEDLPLFYMYISLNVLQSIWFHIGVWASHKGDYDWPTPALSFSLLQNFLLYAAWDMEALDGMDSLNELQACASCRFANRAQWLEASAGLVFVWFDWNFAYLSWV